jgi:hypothetical protein
MPFPPGRHELGPADGTLLVKTFREGVAAKVGHDLVIEVTRWHAVVDGASVALTADPESLEVREAHNGLKPLTDKDRRDVRRNIEEKVLGGRPIAFACPAMSDDASGVAAAGELSIGGVTRPVSATLTRTPEGRLQGTIALRQSDFGITPYKGLMGALKVRDDVEIVIDVAVAFD